MTSADFRAPLRTVVVGAPVAVSAVAFSILDVLASAGRDWEQLHGTSPEPSRFRATLRTLDGRQYQDINGRTVMP